MHVRLLVCSVGSCFIFHQLDSCFRNSTMNSDSEWNHLLSYRIKKKTLSHTSHIHVEVFSNIKFFSLFLLFTFCNLIDSPVWVTSPHSSPRGIRMFAQYNAMTQIEYVFQVISNIAICVIVYEFSLCASEGFNLNLNWILVIEIANVASAVVIIFFSLYFILLKCEPKTINTFNGQKSFLRIWCRHVFILCTQFDESVRLLDLIKILSESTVFSRYIFFPAKQTPKQMSTTEKLCSLDFGIVAKQKTKYNLKCRFDFLGSLSIIYFFVHSLLGFILQTIFCSFFFSLGNKRPFKE